MRVRVLKWTVLGLLLLAGAWLFWRSENRTAQTAGAAGRFSYTAPRPALPGELTAAEKKFLPERVKAALATNAFALRLSNTPKSIGDLVNDPHAILLENALIDTRQPLNFSIPAHLRAAEDAGDYIVQARGPVDAAFRAALARAGAQIISYIPNNAYLVRLAAPGAQALQASGAAQSVVPYEPYYKIQSSLLKAAVARSPLPAGAVLTLGLFADAGPQTISQIEKLGGVVLTREQSPFGPMVRVQPPQDWTALAVLPGVQIVEPFHPRVHANDLSRVSTGVSTDTTNSASLNYLGLSGSNVMVAVSDSGIDATHPDFASGRILGLTPADLLDTNGHGTFVAGEIVGNGSASLSPTAVGAVLASMNYGSVTNADFRGKAPLAKLFSMSLNNSDQTLQAAAAATNALIVNNSWNNGGDTSYDLEAAIYDAGTRDALPLVTGSQPLLFVFSAGNAGGGDDSSDPGGGNPGTIESPGTAKNVITVGAIQELRNITNKVTAADGTTNEPWLPETSTSYRVAAFSSRGNVGTGIEGAGGRFKPDVVAPGTFIVSTRSQQWDTTGYFYQSPTNNIVESFPGIVADPDSLWVNIFPAVPTNAVGVNITVSANANSPLPFPTLPIYVGLYGSPFPGVFVNPQAVANQVNIPSDNTWTMADIFSSEIPFDGFNYGISNINSSPISFDLTTTVILTNSADNHLLVLSNLDNTLGQYYRFESGTSMSAADVSGVLALMQDFFVNHSTLTNPSPALLKALLINGARVSAGVYNYNQPDGRNYEGWGQVNLPNSLPPTIQTNFNGTAASSIFIQDQSRTNALATGDRHTFLLTIQTNNSVTLHMTLAWTDPPGNPAAAIKLVNSLELVVTNLDNSTNPVVYYGNDIPLGGFFNTPESPASTVSPDAINNVQNILIQPLLGTNYSVTVIGRAVNVNAVSAQTNLYAGAPNGPGIFAPNIVQDYALVITAGDGGSPGSFTVTDSGIVSNPTGDPDITYVGTTNTPLMNQMVGAGSPLLGTNTLGLGTNTPWSSAGVVTVGMTNQWHFYVVTNNGAADFTNAAFVTFSPNTLSIPRMGVFAGSQVDATRPEADLDVYVTTDATLTNLNPVAISNCLAGGRVGFSSPPGVTFNGASVGRGGTEYVVDNGGSKPGQVYYIGVKSEDQMASEYDFIPIFSNIPFSFLNANGDEVVNGVPMPVNIPDGTPANPGVNFVFGIALFPIQVGDLTVTNVFTHQNFGDLYGTLGHSGGAAASTVDVLNNHDGWGSITQQAFIYNESYPVSSNPVANIIYQGPSDGPGSLRNFFGQDGSGVWMLTEMDDALTQTGSVQNFTMFIKKQQSLGHGSGVTNTVSAQQWSYNFVDVPAGATNLIISVTNLNGTLNGSALLPLDAYVRLGTQPTTNIFDKMMVITNTAPPPPPGNSLSIGPTDVPPIQPGRYWIGVWNPNPDGSPDQTYSLFATILPPNPTGQEINFAPAGTTSLLDDAVMYSGIYVSNAQPVVSVNVGVAVQTPRISDLVFHLISPDGTRVLLMENRGGGNTNGTGAMMVVTNIVATTNVVVTTNVLSGSAQEYTTTQTVAGWTVVTNQVSLVNDPINASPGNTKLLALANGALSTTIPTVPGQIITVSIPYRGPGITGWWRGENNYNDSIYGNNGSLIAGSVGYVPATVGQGLNFDGGSNRIFVADAPQLNFGANQDLSIEGWISPLLPPPSLTTGVMTIMDKRYSPNSTIGMGYAVGLINGRLYYQMSDLITSPGAAWISSGPDLRDGNMHHVAAVVSRNSTTGGRLFVDGVQVFQFDPTSIPGDLTTTQPFRIGNHPDPSYYSFFKGRIDELSVYRRALSASEIKATYANGAAGKFDPSVFSTSPALSLAEARLSVNGQAQGVLYGNNTNWQTYIATFTAVSNQTSLAFAGLEPGMLLGPLVETASVMATNVVTNIYYLTFTEDTNLTTTPIKYAPPPFVPSTNGSNLFSDGFEQTAAGDYASNSKFGNGWTVTNSQVSVVTDPANAYEGSNFLALASGTVFTNLPTVVGKTYTLTFAYRGPGIAGWWRGENSYNDSIYGNNASTVQNVFLTNGVVGTAFRFDPQIYGTVHLAINDQPIYQLTNELSIEGWIRPRGDGYSIFWRGDNRPGLDPFVISMQGNNIISFGVTDQFTGNASISAPLVYNQWWHIAATFNNGAMKLYTNGILAAQTSTAIRPLGALQAGQNPVISIGNIGNPGGGFPYRGDVDEISLYSRDLSASEVKAIYTNGSAGKFDPSVFSTSPALSLAEAQVSLDGQSQGILYGNNTSWQVETITFTATQNGTPLSITGLEPGMLLDDFVLTQAPGNLYYLPEQSLDAFSGVNGQGTWQLEIQDDRAGAGLTNLLVNWELQFVFANTNPVPLVLIGGIGETNQFLPAGDIAWYQVNVPANVNYATNRLLFASAPLNFWFDTNNPPTTNIFFLNGTNGTVLLSTTNAPATADPNYRQPPRIYDGQTYYLGVQNPNAFTVNYGIEVDFDTTFSSPPVLPVLADTNINELTLLTVTNTATDTNIPAPTLSYTVTMVVATNLMIASNWPTIYATTIPPPVISTNGIITWTPSEAQGPGVYTITTVVTDNSSPPVSATNSFIVTVNEVNQPPVFLYPTNTTVITIPALIPFTNNCVATDLDIPPNPLTFALVSGPTNLTVTTSGEIAWTPALAQLGTNAVSISVTDTNIYALINRSYSVTNNFIIIVTPSNTPPFWATNPLPQTNNELTLLIVTNTAMDSDIPAQTLTYTLGMVVNTNAMIANGWPTNYATTNPPPVISTNGIITWTPSEAQGPGVYIITTVVTDNGLPPSSATNSFQVTVNESNTPPFWPPNVPSQTNYNINALSTLIVTNTAADSDIPPNPLTYQLTGPTNAVIDTNGIITWTPTLAQAPGLYTFTTVVTDTNQFAVNAKSLSATNVFTVSVASVAAPFVFTQPATSVTGTGAQLNGMATPNGQPTTVWFQWGTNTLYGSNTPPVSVGNSFNVVYTTNQISGLAANVPYHFRLVASNALAVVYGFDQILDEANVVVWGANYVGQANVPPGLSNAVAIAGAYDHSLALKNNGTAVAWGDNTFGQATVPAGLSNVAAVAGGAYYSMALKNNGTVTAWGANILGQTNVPAGLSNVVMVAGGTFSSLALKNNGGVVAWGASFFNLTNVPAGASNMVAVAGGSYHSLAIKNDGTIVAWGDNSANQTAVPAGLSNVVAIAGGSYHSLALKYDGTVVAWGDNSAGQISVPAGLSNVVAVAAGGFHNLALKNDGSVVAWGDNSAGQENVSPGLTNFVAISAGYFHSLALTPQSIFNLTNVVLNPTPGVPQTNSIFAGGITYYQVNVPLNADFATNILLFTQNGTVNVWFSTNSPPSINKPGDVELMPNATSGISVLSTTSVPTNIVPGATYYLGVQNTNSFAVNYGIEVDFHLLSSLKISSIVYTNNGTTNGFLLTWFAPSNDLFRVQWNDNLATTNWVAFTNIVSYNTNFPASPASAQFNFFDDGSQTPPGLPPMRFYRLLLLQSNTLTLPSQSNLVVNASANVTVTNTASDSMVGAVLTYSLVNPPANASISTNGIIIWTNAIPSGIAQRFTTMVTDNGVPPAQATNTFTVFVAPFPAITNVTVTATNTVLSWLAPTNDQFQVQWATNLAPVNWFPFPAILTSANGIYTFTDTNAPLVMKFYRLWLLP